MRKKRVVRAKLSYDPLTEHMQNLILRIPRVGSYIARLYVWRAMMFNFMLIGATGVILSFILYEGIFRNIFWNILGGIGAFLATMLVTTLVFFWNYFLNLKLSLSSRAQIMRMKKEELQTLRDLINKRLLE